MEVQLKSSWGISLSNLKLNYSFQRVIAISTAQNDETSIIALYNWILSMEASPDYHFASFSTLIYLWTSQHYITKEVSTYGHLPWVWPLQSNVLSFCALLTCGFLPSPVCSKASLEAIVRLEAEHERPHFVPTVPFTPSTAHFTFSLLSQY